MHVELAVLPKNFTIVGSFALVKFIGENVGEQHILDTSAGKQLSSAATDV